MGAWRRGLLRARHRKKERPTHMQHTCARSVCFPLHVFAHQSCTSVDTCDCLLRLSLHMSRVQQLFPSSICPRGGGVTGPSRWRGNRSAEDYAGRRLSLSVSSSSWRDDGWVCVDTCAACSEEVKKRPAHTAHTCARCVFPCARRLIDFARMLTCVAARS